MLVGESERAGGPSGPGEVVQPGRLIREATPRLVRDAFGPLATFFVGWKLFGLTVGIFLAVAFGILVFLHERRQGRPAALVRVAMAIVCIRAIVGLSSGSATVYLAQEIGIDILLATVVLSGLLSGRPIAAWVASDVYPFTPEMRDSATFSEVMRTVTLVWGFYFLARASRATWCAAEPQHRQLRARDRAHRRAVPGGPARLVGSLHDRRLPAQRAVERAVRGRAGTSRLHAAVGLTGRSSPGRSPGERRPRGVPSPQRRCARRVPETVPVPHA